MALAKSLELAELINRETAFSDHRRLSLYTLGLGLSPDEVKAVLRSHIENGEVTKATLLALIHGQPKLALYGLRLGSKTSLLQQLSIALAGYMSGSLDSDWSETIHGVTFEFEDPYANAILALVSHGDWKDVLPVPNLPLEDRLGIALMYLNDDDLIEYTNKVLAECTVMGDLEGIALTGLTDLAIPLFENFVSKQFDVQTPTLALAYACPRYFTDPRVTVWRETYRSYLDTWQLFLERASFDIESTQLSTSRRSKKTLFPQPGGVSIRCGYCDQSLHRESTREPDSSSKTKQSQPRDKLSNDARLGTSCPQCGRHMPRCVICMIPVGSPDPHTKGAMARQTSEAEAMDHFINLCRGCWHVSHSVHAEEWFERHETCPIADCDCRCVEINNIDG